MAGQKPKVEIEVHTRQTGQGGALANVRNQLRDIVGAVPGVSGALGAVATAAGAVAGAIAGAAKAVREFAASERQVAQMDAALARVGKLSGETREKLQGLAGELQKATAIADDEWLGVLTRLVQFGADPASIGMDAEAVKNLAGVVGSLTTATNLYTKALSGNFRSLKEYGIHVESITDLQKAAAKGAGQLEAQAQSLSGRFQNLSNTMSDFAEAIGQNIASGLRLGDALDFIAGGFEWWAEKLSSTVEQLEGVHNQTGRAARSAEDYADQLKRISEFADRVASSTDKATSAIRGQQAAQDEVADAKMALDLARVDADEKAGRIDPKRALAARYQIRRDAANAQFARAQGADLAVMTANEEALKQLVSQRAALEPMIAAARAAADQNSRTDRDRALAEDLIQRGRALMAWKPGAADFIGGPSVANARMVAKQQEGIQMFAAGTAAAARFAQVSEARSASLDAVSSTASDLDRRIAEQSSSTLRGNIEIGQRMTTRATVHQLHAARDGLSAPAASGMQQSLESTQQTSRLMTEVANRFLAIQRDTEARLNQVLSQLKNQRTP